jgi:beta-fructofuranosidase
MNFNRRNFVSRALELAAAGSLISPLSCFARAHSTSSSSRLANDPLRPQFHLLPAKNWMNDPNGPIFWNGQYHMFYQYNPNGAFWGDMHWGHAVSPDLVHWQHLPIALSPSPDGPDADGCFSGAAIAMGNQVAMIYTGVKSVPKSLATLSDGAHNFRETQCLAISDDTNLTRWRKLPKPVIPTSPRGLEITGFRDPSVWRSGEWYYLTVGSGIQGKGGAVLLYRSKDLRNWEYLHIVASGKGNGRKAANAVDSGDMWECPELFPLGDKHVLIYATDGKVYWQSGSLDEQTMVFHPEQTGTVDFGSYYAAKTQLDKDGNRILWGWIPETRPLEEYRAAGWAGVMSLPRVLTLASDGQLLMRFASALSILRGSTKSGLCPQRRSATKIDVSAVSLKDCCGEIICEAENLQHPGKISLVDHSSGGEVFGIGFDPSALTRITVDGQELPLALNDRKFLVHMYVDGSVIETVFNDRVASTKRFYYPGERAPELEIRVLASDWQMKAISSNRLTGVVAQSIFGECSGR